MPGFHVLYQPEKKLLNRNIVVGNLTYLNVASVVYGEILLFTGNVYPCLYRALIVIKYSEN